MAVRVSEDIVSISDLKARAPELFKRAAKTGQPLVVTQNGRAAAVVLSPAEYDRLTEHERFIAGVKRGLADIEAGRVVDHETVVTEMKKRFGSKR